MNNTEQEYNEVIDRLKWQSRAIYIAIENPVADDLSHSLKLGATAIEKLQRVQEYVDKLASDRNFKPVSIVEDVRMILDDFNIEMYQENTNE